MPLAFMVFFILTILHMPLTASAWVPSSFHGNSHHKLNAIITSNNIHTHNQRAPVLTARMAKKDNNMEEDNKSHSSSSSKHKKKNDVEEEEPHHLTSIENDTEKNSKKNMTAGVMKRVRVAKAQAEIDRILQGPDAPVDIEAELEKVVSMTQLPSEQPLVDAEMEQLESELYQAVKSQDFTLASTKKAQLHSLQNSGIPTGRAGATTTTDDTVIDNGGAILQVNAAFYRAFSTKSLPDMEQVWLSHDDPGGSICIHPSHKPLVGTRRISKSWQQMFASTDKSFQRNWMEPHKINIMIQGSTMAVVTCEEHIFARRFVRGQKRQTELINKLLATNIFRKVAGRWYMCYHHASWHPESDAAERALSGGNLNHKGNSRVIPDVNSLLPPQSSHSSAMAKWNAIQRRRKRRLWEDEEDDEYNEQVGMDGILGSDFGPILGDEKKKDNNNSGDNNGQPTKRIIMGASLSDLLNGGLDGLLGGNSDDENPGSKNGQNNNGLPQQGAIIQFSRIEDNSDDDDDDDDELIELDIDDSDDDDDDDDDEEDEIDHEGESVAIIKEWAKSSARRTDVTSSSATGRESSPPSDTKKGGKQSSSSKGLFKDALRQNCISALRKLSDQGTISPKQKRVLLTDIITCSSKGEFSMVEVAYELLCSEEDSEEDETAEEEFAEQCRVFAQEKLRSEQASAQVENSPF